MKLWYIVDLIHSSARPRSHSLVVSLHSCGGNAARAGTDLAVNAFVILEAWTGLLILPSFAAGQTPDAWKCSRVDLQTCWSGSIRGNERVKGQKTSSRLLIRLHRTSGPPHDLSTRRKYTMVVQIQSSWPNRTLDYDYRHRDLRPA